METHGCILKARPHRLARRRGPLEQAPRLVAPLRIFPHASSILWGNALAMLPALRFAPPTIQACQSNFSRQS